MAGLIEEIQRDALDTKVPIDALLRRVKLAAAKLQLKDLAAWVDQELNGYKQTALPSYREVWGNPAAWNPFNGWIPVHCADSHINELISKARINEPIASIRDLIDRGANDTCHFSIPAQLVDLINQRLNFETARMVIQIPRGGLVGILDKVRNLSLEWAIEMEQRGIVGEGISFNVRERQEAQTAMANFTIGSIGNFSGNLGVENRSGDIKVSLKQATEISSC
ncbi:hypothetical protein [Shinella sp.]|uniref:AbiTii domain-containing protein n=1 Tax=Shinella sp. TaxID=1870904 RepID=UPI003D28917E